ncbi:MAG TPA: acetylglutamate kinase [Chloroflexi bacterium]|jgi:acetylglutamate kinase|nr:acetylglutamate kinase [Chloroflexota bacterium]
MEPLMLIKVGGAELAEGDCLERLADALAATAQRSALVIVHGGGPEIAALQQRLGLVPAFVEGLRVTDEDSLRVAEMVLSGSVNKRLAARLVCRGVKALGLSGVDAGLLQAQRLAHPAGDLGCVGEITSVRSECLRELIGLGYTPVISPISLGSDGRSYNVNADHAALAIAQALGAAEMVFLTDVPGVMRDGQVLAGITDQEAQAMIAEGVITGGMIPKVTSALTAIARGVGVALITNLAGLAAGSGTRLVAHG